IITRLYKDLATAQGVLDALTSAGHDASTIDVIARDGAGAAEVRMAEARVPKASAAAYGPGIAKGNALLVVRAPFAPIGTARHAIRVVNRTPAINVGVADEDHYIREQAKIEKTGTVLPGTVFYMSNPHRSAMHGHIMGSNPISPAKPRTSAIRGGAHMSTKFWPMKLLSAPKERTSAAGSGFLFSSLFGIPTLIGDLPSRTMVKTTT
ncbi:MAG: hypothetical protein ACRCS0_06265, partial [Albidovulum sp.]